MATLPRATKFAVVLGTMLPNRPITTLPTGLPPTARSKNTLSVTVVVTSGSALVQTKLSRESSVAVLTLQVLPAVFTARLEHQASQQLPLQADKLFDYC